KFVRQGSDEDRTIAQTLDVGWGMFTQLPESELEKRIDRDLIKKYHMNYRK
ncbi:MAG TPA: V-type ATP synthase subunit B, partial [Methanocorpusculum sp.]|nr:V-type ATP synthase subunit B [Methanocorpusculum sp.]